MLLSIGDQIGPGTYRPHSRFSRVVNFERQGRLVSVVDRTIGPGPLNLVIRNLCAGPWERAGQELQVGSNTVRFAGHCYHFTPRHRYNSTLDVPAVDIHRFRLNLSALGELLKQASPPKSLAFLLDPKRRKNFRAGFERTFAEQITQGVREIFQGQLLAGVRGLKGCGLGLTPSGDDFIAGLLIGLHVLQNLRGQDFQLTVDAVFRAAQGNNIYSHTFLDLARRGLLSSRVKDLLRALLSGSRGSIRKASEALFAVGASSGADLATGLFMTLHASGSSTRKKMAVFL